MSNNEKNQLRISERGNRKFLYIAACTANITAFTCGTAFGWTSPTLPKLLNNTENTLSEPITLGEASWIGSLLPIGAAIGPFAAGIAIDRLGRKNTLILSTLPMILAFTLYAYATRTALFYAGRFLGGLSVGGIFTVLPIYISEISEDDVRGALGSLMQLFITFGLLFSFSIGPYIDITNFNLLAVLSPIAFIFIFIAYIPETPHFYIAQNDMVNAEISLAKLRGTSRDGVRDELEAIKATVDESMASKGGFTDIFKSPGLTKAFILSVGLVSLQQLSGINVILFYTQNIFEATGSSIQPDVATIIVGVVQVTCSFLPPLLADRLGRRVLLMTSGLFMGIAQVALGYYFYLKENGGDVSSMFWLPVACLVLYNIFYCLGFGPLPWAVMGELFPAEVKSSASTVTASACWFLGFLLTKFFVSVAEVIGNGGSFWFFSGCCFFAVGFVYKFLPETSGKSLHEIQNILSGKK